MRFVEIDKASVEYLNQRFPDIGDQDYYGQDVLNMEFG